jgi:hypothetical protein
MTSEKRKAKAAPDTSVDFVLFRFRSYIFGLGSVDLTRPVVVVIEGADGREKRVELVAGDKCSADESEEAERTEKRGCCGCP